MTSKTNYGVNTHNYVHVHHTFDTIKILHSVHPENGISVS